MRTVVQIGLHKSYEWAYLSKGNWLNECLLKPKSIIVPEYFRQNPDPFDYIGIDVMPESVDYCSKKAIQEGYTNTKWLCVGVSSHCYLLESWDQTLNLGANYLGKNSPTILNFISLPTLLKLLKLDELSILALDIEGYEYHALNQLSKCHVLPKFLSVEFHDTWYFSAYESFKPNCDRNVAIKHLRDIGYSEIEFEVPLDLGCRHFILK